MVQTDEYIEGANVTVDMIEKSPSKRLVIINEAVGKDTDYGRSLYCDVEIDGKQKHWYLNADTIENLRNIGKDSRQWIGVACRLMVITANGKKRVIGIPIGEGKIEKLEEPEFM